MSEKKQDSSDPGAVMQPRLAQHGQLKRQREKRAIAVATQPRAAEAAAANQVRVAKQGQAKTLKQLGARVVAQAAADLVEAPKVTRARPMQLRQLSARKSVSTSTGTARFGSDVIIAKVQAARTAQGRQMAQQKRTKRRLGASR